MSKRKTRQDWITEGIKCLKNKGPSSLSAEQLSKALGVTRGSFYHHFANIAEFNNEILNHWERTNTTLPFQEAKEKAGNHAEELTQLVEESWHTDTELEVAVRSWATINEQARKRVETLDGFRLNYLIHLYREVVGDKEKGTRFAQIAFYGLLGAIHAQPRIPEKELGKLINAIQSLMLNELS